MASFLSSFSPDRIMVVEDKLPLCSPIKFPLPVTRTLSGTCGPSWPVAPVFQRRQRRLHHPEVPPGLSIRIPVVVGEFFSIHLT
jgi:hypothetical protein